MKHWWLVMALLLSVGINIGILAGRAWPERPAPSVEEPAVDPEANEPGSEPSTSEPGNRPWSDRQPRFVERMANELRLSGDDRERFIRRQVVFFEETLAARMRFGRLQNELRRELIGGEPDRDRLDALLEDIGVAHVELERAFVENLLDTREILDPEQQRRYLHFLQRLRRSNEDTRRRIQEQLQRSGGTYRDRPAWRQRRAAERSAEPAPPTDEP